MKFGIEIEFGGSVQDVLNELYADGLAASSSISSYVGFSQTHWTVKRDASVRNGGELVSPPMEFTDQASRDSVDRAVACLRRAGARPIADAGIHVHIESTNFTPKEISSVTRVWSRYEDAIYRLASSGWATLRNGARNYARKLTQEQKTGLASARSVTALQRAYYQTSGDLSYTVRNHGHGARYYGLNLHSHWYRGTIEFRVFNSSVNSERVQMYIALCHAIMTDAKAGKVRSINQGAHALGSMHRGDADPDKVIFNLLNILKYQGGEMSLQDYRLVKKFWKDSTPQSSMVA